MRSQIFFPLPIFSFIILLSLFLQPGCKKDEVTNIYVTPSHQTLVFLSDFEEDSDVTITILGNLKTSYPDLKIEFIHAKPFDIKEAAYQLEVAVREYPDSTFFMGMVEPGASDLRMVFEAESGKKFVIPDNGLASRIFKYMITKDYYYIENPLDDSGQDPYELNYEEFYLKAISLIISGKPLSSFGNPIQQPVTYPIRDPIKVNDTIIGEVIFTDNFGNCITNIPDTLMADLQTGSLLKVTGDTYAFFATYGDDYAAVPENQNVILIDRSKRVELAVSYGSLSQRYTFSAGSQVKLFPGIIRIGILQFNDISDGFVETMKIYLQTNGFTTPQNTLFFERNANGDLSRLHDLVIELLEEQIDIIVPFSTPATQAAVIATPEAIPVVFSIVTDPVSAGVLTYRQQVTGLSNATDFNAFIAFSKRVLPELSIAGSIYNDQETNSAEAQQQLENICPLHGIEFIHAAILSIDSISVVYQSIMEEHAEVILITNDNTMTQVIPQLVALSLNDTIPVLGTDYSNTQMGALASISVDYDLISKKTGEVVIAVIRGVDPDELPIMYFETDIIAVNTQTASLLGYVFDPDLLDAAKYIFP